MTNGVSTAGAETVRAGTSRGIEFGLCLPQFTSDAHATVLAAQEAEADGYDAVSLFDHLRPLGGPPDRPILECLTMLTAVATATSRVRLLPLVLRAPLRPPATVAAAFRTLAMLAPGRLVCGVGGGDRLNEAEDVSVGLPSLDPESRRQAIRAVLAAMHLAAPDVPCWIGGTSAAIRAMAGEIGDGWNVWGARASVVQVGAAEVAVAAQAAARPQPRITWGGQVVLAASPEQARNSLTGWGSGRSDSEIGGVISGDAAGVAAALGELMEAGVQTFLLSFVGSDAAVARRAFAADVLPVVRRMAAI